MTTAEERIDTLERAFGPLDDPANPLGTAALLAADAAGEVLPEGPCLGDAVVGQRSVRVAVVELEPRQALLAGGGGREVADALPVPHEDELGRARGRHVTLSTRHGAS